MSETYNLSLPLVAAAQAQKHVTVNAALARLDALAQLRVVSATQTAPPAAPVDGQSYIVPTGATDAWAGRTAQIAVFSNGGWDFVAPRTGWTAFNAATGGRITFDGAGWAAQGDAVSAGGAATIARVVEIDHALSAGATSTVSAAIPAQMVVYGVTGRVVSAIEGTLSAWRLGVQGSDNRYGSGLGLGQNSFVRGLTGQPQTYYGDTDLILSAEGGDFTGGLVRLAVHGVTFQPPAEV